MNNFWSAIFEGIKYSFWIYPKYRIRRFFFSDFPLFIACRLPASVMLWCFVIVYGDDGCAPSQDYKDKYDHWCNKYLEDNEFF